MFIVSPTKGGYRGDVNTAFRTGRQEAFDDYINSYNKALQADNNTYNFNQRVVRDTAGNYKLQNGMAKSARDEAYDFAKKSTDIADAQFNFDRKKAELDYINKNGGAEGMGKVDGNFRQTESYNKLTKEQQDYNNRLQFGQQKLDSTSNVAITNNENAIYKNQLQSKFNHFNNKNSFTNARIASKVKELQENGDTRSPQEIEAELRGDSAFLEGVESERQAGLEEARQEIENFNSNSVTTNSKNNKQEVPKFTTTAVDFSTDAMKPVVDFVNAQLKPYGKNINSFQEGDAFLGPKGEIYQIIGGKPHVLNFKDAHQRALYLQSQRRANLQQTSKPTSTPSLGN